MAQSQSFENSVSSDKKDFTRILGLHTEEVQSLGGGKETVTECLNIHTGLITLLCFTLIFSDCTSHGSEG